MNVFAVSRDIWTDPRFKAEPFTQREAFMWLVSEASFTAREVRCGDFVVMTERGQLCHSMRFMAKAWQWHYSSVSRFLNALEKRNTIRMETETGVTVVTICNYDEFQFAPADAETRPKHDRNKL